jgi:hypothetical protein
MREFARVSQAIIHGAVQLKELRSPSINCRPFLPLLFFDVLVAFDETQ